MIEHLDHCQRCRNEVGTLSEFVGDGGAEPVRWARRGRWLAAAAAIAVVVGGTVLWRNGIGKHSSAPVAPLVAAAGSLEFRLVESRLSGGFAWAEFRGPVRSSTQSRNPNHLKLAGAAGEVLQRAETDIDPDAQHAAAVASLLIGDHKSAIERLRRVTREQPDDARAWNDLAAAQYAYAMRFNSASEQPLALAAVNRALDINAAMPEALFNRALIVERIGVLAEARDAWERYLEVDAGSDWAREARQRLDALPTATDQSLFDKDFPALERAVAKNDVAAVARFVERFPEQTRRKADVETLGAWAEAYRDGNMAEAQKRLALVRAVGAALRERSGEAFLADAAAAIDRLDHTRRTRMADGYLAYREGRKALGRRKTAAARDGFARAVGFFHGIWTPGVFNARYYATLAQYADGKLEETVEELEQLLAFTARFPQYKALRAQIAWQLGLVQGRLARWHMALQNYRIAHVLFSELGERSNTAFVGGLLGETATFLGRPDDAWQVWSQVFRSLSEQGHGDRLAVWLSNATQTELVAGRTDSASALLDLELRHGAQQGPMRAETLFRRAMLSARLGDLKTAKTALAEGRQVAAELKDPQLRAGALADLHVAEGIALASTDPQRALGSLTHAVDHHRQTRRMLLPAALYERARLYRTLERDEDARRDLEAAVAAIEEQRGVVAWRDTRSGALDGADQIYVALAELLLERGMTDDAFAATDRAAAHAFFGAAAAESVSSVDALQRQLPPGAVVVEYLVLPRETVMFVVGARGCEMRRVRITADEVSKKVAALDAALRDRAAFSVVHGAASSLHATLIAPVRDLLIGAESITFVADPRIAATPFAALFDVHRGRWLVEDHAIRIAASALYRPGTAPPEDVERVVVIRPSGGDVDLPAAQAEAAAILQVYPHAALIEGRATSTAAVLAAIGDASVVHYAGHADSERDAGLVLRVAAGQAELLYGADIARTSLKRAPLVVLAGCRTLRGGERRDDLAASLARAFLLAGARAVVGTSWDVDDDAAAMLFGKFHELHAASGDPVSALRDTQRLMLHDPERHTADWAFAQIVVRSLEI